MAIKIRLHFDVQNRPRPHLAAMQDGCKIGSLHLITEFGNSQISVQDKRLKSQVMISLSNSSLLGVVCSCTSSANSYYYFTKDQYHLYWLLLVLVLWVKPLAFKTLILIVFIISIIAIIIIIIQIIQLLTRILWRCVKGFVTVWPCGV